MGSALRNLSTARKLLRQAPKRLSASLLGILIFLLGTAPLAAEPDGDSRPITIGEYFSGQGRQSQEAVPEVQGAPVETDDLKQTSSAPAGDAQEDSSSSIDSEESSFEEVQESTAVNADAEIQARPPGGGELDFTTTPGDGQYWREKAQTGQSTFFERLRTVVWALAFICLLIWGLGKLLGRAALGRLGLPSESMSHIEILERKRLSPGRSIMLMRVGPKVLAVAATETGYQTLTEMSEEDLLKHSEQKAQQPSEGKLLTANETGPPTSPEQIAKHYLSILPGIGAKR